MNNFGTVLPAIKGKQGGRTFYGAYTGGGFTRGGGAGGVRRDAEVTAAQRAVSSGGDVGEAVARVQNAGGGEIKLNKDQVADALSLRRGVAVSENGALMLDMGKISDSALLKGEIKMFDRNGKEMKMERTVTVQIVENGISGFRVGTAGGTFQPARQKAEITDEQRQAILGANLPLQLKGARFNSSGQINGFKINPEQFDKPTRAALYKNSSPDGTMRFSPNSPVGKALAGQLGDSGINIQKLNNLLG
jgi:hypothetical protein